ncbi:Low-density lipo receptor-related 4 [Paramuricea clavata]|uniref:Low-density lipo receptor-related 4 n=1 Tax=Paramuricea clavata TaxID=317549 RepID=A0A6S7HV11_PARCT|nr:Low-density lipo receptor-related 4 [Paramuricea clavata]
MSTWLPEIQLLLESCSNLSTKGTTGFRLCDMGLIADVFCLFKCPECDCVGLSLEDDDRRGHSTLNGCVTVISMETGKVLDVEALTSHCKECKYYEKLEKNRWSETMYAKLNVQTGMRIKCVLFISAVEKKELSIRKAATAYGAPKDALNRRVNVGKKMYH